MNQKKEVQDTILKEPKKNQATKEELFAILKTIAPGTNLRAAIDGALKVGKGALIVVENDSLAPLLDGGFKVNCKFTPQKLMELTKMDGAITLSKDLKRITNANVTLAPDSRIKSSETGTRHKAGERTAKQTSGLVIAISERRHEVSIFYKNMKYILKNTDDILRKANEQIQLLEKHREIFDKHVEKLNALELRNYISLNQAIKVIQKGKLIQKIAKDLKLHIIELGTEGHLLEIRLKEIVQGVEKETDLVIKDYTSLNLKKSKSLLEAMSYHELLDNELILKALAFNSESPIASIKGWRMMSKTSLPNPEIALVLKEFGSLGKIMHSRITAYNSLLGEERAIKFKEEIERIKLNH